MTKQPFNTRLTPEVIDEIRRRAKRDGISQNDVIAKGMACQCDGRGVIGLYRGEWIFCTCCTGIGYAMDEIASQMQIFADDLATMPEMESNREQREVKQAHFDRLGMQFDMLDAERERQGRDALS
jgi:hypothetical protein